MGKIILPGQPVDVSTSEEYTPPEVEHAVNMVIARSKYAKLGDSGLLTPEGLLEDAKMRVHRKLMRVRKWCDHPEQFELLMVAAYNSEDDMEQTVNEYLERIKAGTLEKPDTVEWVAEKEGLLAGRPAKKPNRQQRRWLDRHPDAGKTKKPKRGHAK